MPALKYCTHAAHNQLLDAASQHLKRREDQRWILLHLHLKLPPTSLAGAQQGAAVAAAGCCGAHVLAALQRLHGHSVQLLRWRVQRSHGSLVFAHGRPGKRSSYTFADTKLESVMSR